MVCTVSTQHTPIQGTDIINHVYYKLVRAGINGFLIRIFLGTVLTCTLNPDLSVPALSKLTFIINDELLLAEVSWTKGNDMQLLIDQLSCGLFNVLIPASPNCETDSSLCFSTHPFIALAGFYMKEEPQRQFVCL